MYIYVKVIWISHLKQKVKCVQVLCMLKSFSDLSPRLLHRLRNSFSLGSSLSLASSEAQVHPETDEKIKLP